ncbi:MAG TPA: flavodoxin domain-containing protein [Clostridiaceae bacterium]|nr:flavodoxin domain-containing protein [Clostridiaceae bacterium]
MKTLVVYDSYFGNTEKIAKEVAYALSGKGNVRLRRVTEVTPEDWEGLKLLVVGTPTRAFKPSPGTMKFIKEIPRDRLKGVRVAAFDTRMDVKESKSKVLNVMAGIFGYAALPLSKKLVEKGGTLLLDPEGFIVKDSEGPLKEGEVERVREWLKKALPGGPNEA